MFSLIFAILMMAVFGEFIWIAGRLAWGLWKIVMSIIFFPILMVILTLSGLIMLAIPILIVVGIIAVVLTLAG